MPSDSLTQKLSFTFQKQGRARFFSHHDMMRLFERALRRAELPVRLTKGFNPRPRMVFPHALGLGIGSRCEEVEVELVQRTVPEEAVTQLSAGLGASVAVTGVTRLPPVRKGRVVERTTYRAWGWSVPEERLNGAVLKLLAVDRVEVTRGAPGKEKTVNLREYVADIKQEHGGITFALRHTPRGAGRADEVVTWIAEQVAVAPERVQVEKIAMRFA